MKTLSQVSKREIVLALALFLNPLAYNELFAGIMSLTHSYWVTASVLYTISGFLFIVYLALKFKDKRKG